MRRSRFLRTALPLLASDLLALFFAGCCAVCLALLLDPAWVTHVGWVLTASLMPLAVAYWPGALYPGVGLVGGVFGVLADRHSRRLIAAGGALGSDRGFA